ncbi:transglutaminase family protein [Bifidobacterium sp.]|jgi:transglutaminase-like putative cysteine protease|uniref:transglutaminase family protein n=1 Tax=Bifidobacterium sp. TaxID=41200 RepID=UPI0025BCB9CF|nr:transglutaminase family protein [Bifidobacterium sp.]MCH4208983.1 transglutaminase family protein [Bifidobacterium sp.]MCI1224934.1 transglutaminase family protein [Bifidobacterium sp.]
MKKLVFDYETKLSFSAPVTDHRFQLRCVPATGPRQQVVDVEVEMDPQTELETTVDSFDSVVKTGFIRQAHDVFRYSVKGIAFVDTENTKPEPYKPLYRFDSALTVPGPAIGNMIATCRAKLTGLDGDATAIDRAQVVMNEVFKAFAYTPGATTIRTTAEQALTQGAGVCQDYAHAMLSVCRHLGLTARYIAGLLGGEGATHAWVEVYHNDRWIGLDPTHSRMVDDNYITIAHGRDYRDCMLDIGIFSGANVRQTQWVNASVHEQQPA